MGAVRVARRGDGAGRRWAPGIMIRRGEERRASGFGAATAVGYIAKMRCRTDAVLPARRTGVRLLAAPALLASAAVLALTAGCATSANPQFHGRSIESLSGVWKGTVETTEVGNCPRVQNPGKQPARATVAFRADRGIEMHPYAGRIPDVTSTVSGVVARDWQIRAVWTAQANCQGGKRESRANLVGHIEDSPEGPTIVLDGVYETCPESGCRFTVEWRLVRERRPGER